MKYYKQACREGGGGVGGDSSRAQDFYGLKNYKNKDISEFLKKLRLHFEKIL